MNEVRPPVDYIMSKPVYSVKQNHDVGQAYKIMKTHGTKKILVKGKDDKPIGVLESWKITSKDYDRKIKDMPLGKIELMPEDTDIDAVEAALSIVSAVYLTDRKNSNQINGVVTAYDLYKAV